MAYAEYLRPAKAVKAGAFAALAAGPAFLFGISLANLVEDSANGIHVQFEDIGAATLFIMVSVPFGAIIAFLPCVLAATLLAALTRRRGVSRLPIVWILAGGLMAGPIGLFIDEGTLIPFAFAATGAICAAIARHKLEAGSAPIDSNPVQPARIGLSAAGS